MFFDNDYDNDGFSSLIPSDEPAVESQEAENEPIAERVELVNEEPQPTQAEHNKRFAERRLKQKQQREEQERIQQLEAKIAQLEQTVLAPKLQDTEEGEDDFLERFTEKPKEVLESFFKEKAPQHDLPPEATEWLEQEYESIFENEAGQEVVSLRENFATLAGVQPKELEPIAKELAYIAKELDSIHEDGVQAYRQQFLRITDNGKNANAPWVQSQLRGLKENLAKTVADVQMEFLNQPQFKHVGEFLAKNYNEPQHERQAKSLPKNARQLKDETVPVQETPFKRINVLYRD